ncbi:MAG: Ig-like domain repeat protein [Candidatus Thermoplasmatota archaeon]|nr:Ig-like domain repeat protein [Candidatus Thermoplasmatota archaeon]
MKRKLLRSVAAVCALLFCSWALASLITSVNVIDRDDDGLSDTFEKTLRTNSLNPDSDYDELADGEEYQYWLNRSQQEQRDELHPLGDVDEDLIPNILDYDSDNDNVPDGVELKNGTDPANPDTDGDGLLDGQECTCGACCHGGSCALCTCGQKTNPLNPDSDGDGILDSQEAGESGVGFGGSGGKGNGEGSSGELRYSSNTDPLKTRDILRFGFGGNPECYVIFNPSIDTSDRLKRWLVYDAISEEYTAYVTNESLSSLDLSDIQYEYIFRGVIPLEIIGQEPIAIPSVAPNANIISYSCTVPEMVFEFFKDGADTYYVKPIQNWYYQEVNLTILTSAPASYYHLARHSYADAISETLTLSQIPEGIIQTPPSSVRSAAAFVIDTLGLTGETNVQLIMSELIHYFNSFTEGEIPSEEEEPNPYLATALAGHGACYVRSFAFFITANCIGIPTRLVTNECHAFVESYIPPYGWSLIDLGGLGPCGCCNRLGADVFDIPDIKNAVGNQTLGNISTITTLTEVTSSAYIGGAFLAKGTVTDTQLQGIPEMPVKIYVKKDKAQAGVSTGVGVTDANGVFSIECQVAGVIEPGINHVVAKAQGLGDYKESSSDPTMEVLSNTTLSLVMPTSIGLNDEVTIWAFLQDAGTKPLPGRTVRFYWNNSLVATRITNDQGTANVTYQPSVLGKHVVKAQYSGEQYLAGSMTEQDIFVMDKSTRLNISVSSRNVTRNESITVNGTLTSLTSESMASQPIQMFLQNKLLMNTTTSAAGSFATTLTIPVNCSLGNATLIVLYPGDSGYAEARDTETLLVQSDTTITLTMPSITAFFQNVTFLVIGTLNDDQEAPLAGMPLQITGDFPRRNATTDTNGSFNVSMYIPRSVSTGNHAFRVSFSGTEVYRESTVEKTVQILTESTGPYPLLFGLAALLLSIVLVVGFLFLRNRKKKRDIKQSLEEIIALTLSRLQTEKDHRKTILECYQKMCELLEKKGIRKEEGYTPREFALVAREYLAIQPDHLYELTKVFEKARYSDHDINEQDREHMFRCLKTIVFSPVQKIRRKPLGKVSG